MRAASGISSPRGRPGSRRRRSARARRARRADPREQAADALEHALALDGVGLHDRPLVVVERAGLVDDLVRDRDLADVVQQRGELGRAAGLVVDAEVVGDRDGQLDDVLGVLAGVLVVGLDDVAEQQRGAAVGAPRARASARRGRPARAAKMAKSRPAAARAGRRRAASTAANAASSPTGESSRSTRWTRSSRASGARRLAEAARVPRSATTLEAELRGQRHDIDGPVRPVGRLAPRATRRVRAPARTRRRRPTEDALGRRARARVRSARAAGRAARPSAARSASAGRTASGRTRSASARRTRRRQELRSRPGVRGDEHGGKAEAAHARRGQEGERPAPR